MLFGLIGWVLPPSRMPAAGTSAPEPDSTWPLAQPSSCTFGGYDRARGLPRLIRWPPTHSARCGPNLDPRTPPDRGLRDWALVAALVGWSLVEVVLRQDLAPRPGRIWTGLAPRPLLLLAVLAVLGPLLWRRTHPLVAVVVSFGTLTIVDIVRILTGSQGGLLNSISAALILAYALFRWGSGREAASGLGVILLWLPITTVADPTSLAE